MTGAFTALVGGALTWMMSSQLTASPIVPSALGFCPRFDVKYTSREAEGQVYIPAVNWAMFLGCVAITLTFRTAGDLAAAYGIAVTGTMGITTLCLSALGLFYVFATHSFATLFNYVDLDDANRIAMDQLTRDIRQSDSIASFATNQLVLQDSDGRDAGAALPRTRIDGSFVNTASGSSSGAGGERKRKIRPEGPSAT